MSRFYELGFYYQVQAVAVPANLSDPMLVDWVKPASNPVVAGVPVGATNLQFRDPNTAWYQVRARGHRGDCSQNDTYLGDQASVMEQHGSCMRGVGGLSSPRAFVPVADLHS